MKPFDDEWDIFEWMQRVPRKGVCYVRFQEHGVYVCLAGPPCCEGCSMEPVFEDGSLLRI
jgi:hypothetical protein